ncbi:MAG TPA: ROK family protein [Bacteroidales bacterium]|nr:ROK family protein [Bacteroidales bacterium]
MEKNIAVGVDIGGSHITSAAVDMTSGKVLKETMADRPVNNQAQAFEIIDVWSSCLQEVMGHLKFDDIRGIGFAMPGPFDYVNGICYIKGVSKYENLYGFNIGDAVKSKLELPDDFGIRFINDASAFAVGEAWAGKAKDYRKSMCITLGTGLGSAFISDRIPVVDGPDVPKIGCVYHLPYGESIADDYFSTRWFIRSYKEATGKETGGVKELSDLAHGDKTVQGLFMKFGNDLAVFLAPWLKKFGAEILVIGGNISNAYHLFGEVFEGRLRKESWKGDVGISELKEDAALLGSAYLFDDHFWKAVQHALPLM